MYGKSQRYILIILLNCYNFMFTCVYECIYIQFNCYLDFMISALELIFI